MCLNIGTPNNHRFPFVINGKVVVLGVPILKHFRVYAESEQNLAVPSCIADFRMPWSALAESKEQYSLRWESKYLYQLGEAFDYLLQTGISMATTEALKYTVLSGKLDFDYQMFLKNLKMIDYCSSFQLPNK